MRTGNRKRLNALEILEIGMVKYYKDDSFLQK